MNKRYIVYKVSGGLNHMLNQINNAIYFSKVCKRILIIDCYSGAFKNDFNKYFLISDLEYFTSYDILEKNQYIKIKDYIDSVVKYKKDKYVLLDKRVDLTCNEILESNEDILFFTYLNNSASCKGWDIKINPNILNELEKYDIKEDYIGIHFRNTDYKHDLNKIIEIAKLITDTNLIYFSTDDFSAYEIVKNLMPEYKIIRYTSPYQSNGKNIHYSNPDKDQVILNTLIDMYCLLKCKHFIPSEKSSMSKRIERLREKNDLFIK